MKGKENIHKILQAISQMRESIDQRPVREHQKVKLIGAVSYLRDNTI